MFRKEKKPVCVLKNNEYKATKNQFKKHKKDKNVIFGDDDNNDDDDGAPEEVTFKEGLQKMLENKKMILEKLEEDEERLKAKRKRQDELYKEQKRQKLIQMEQMKLPNDILENIDDAKLNKKSKMTKNNGKPFDTDKMDDEDDDIDNDNENDDNEDVNSMNRVDKKENDDISMTEDASDDNEAVNNDNDDNDNEGIEFLPVVSSLRAVYANEKIEDRSTVEKALQFKNKHLFGARVKRQSAEEYLSVQAKRKARKL